MTYHNFRTTTSPKVLIIFFTHVIYHKSAEDKDRYKKHIGRCQSNGNKPIDFVDIIKVSLKSQRNFKYDKDNGINPHILAHK